MLSKLVPEPCFHKVHTNFQCIYSQVNVFLADMKDFAAMNEVYSQYWGQVKPCRTCVLVFYSSRPGITEHGQVRGGEAAAFGDRC